MNELANFFSLSPVYSIATVGAAGVVGLVIGYLLKSSVVRKHKKRVLSLENEMLSNHSRILELEKQVTELKNENIKLTEKDKGSGSSKLKAS
jgi:hypothetical protein